MNLKDENVQPASRFGFRFQPSKSFVNKKKIEDTAGKHISKNCLEVKTSLYTPSNKSLNKQQVLTSKDGAINLDSKKSLQLNQLCFDQNSASSNDSNTSLKSKTHSFAISHGRNATQEIKSLRANTIEVNHLVASRRSRSRDACRNVKNQVGIKDAKFRDQIGMIKSRSKSREYGLKSGDNKLRISTKADEGKTVAKCSSRHMEVASLRNDTLSPVVDINCNIKEQTGINMTDQASLRADLSFLRRKLIELKNVLSVGTSNVDDVEISSLKEENCLLKEENYQLKEKLKSLESQLNLKLKYTYEINENTASLTYLPVSIDESIENLHDSSVNSNQNHKNPSKNKNCSKLLDSNDNILHKSSSFQNSSCGHPLLDVTQHDGTLCQTSSIGTEAEKNVKRPSQLPLKLMFKRAAPLSNSKANAAKDFSPSAAMLRDKIALEIPSSNDPKVLLMPRVKSQRISK